MSVKLTCPDPIQLFDEWFQEAKKVYELNPDAAALATATPTGKPSVRIILLKAFSEQGFVFYTNLGSKKAKELIENPQGALCFYWTRLEKQIRLEGHVEQIDDEEADKYFASRQYESKIVAWASNQSQVMKQAEDLHHRYHEYEKKFKKPSVPRPDFWSGFRLIPETIEFWKAGKHRLHKRILYAKKQGKWDCCYLYP